MEESKPKTRSASEKLKAAESKNKRLQREKRSLEARIRQLEECKAHGKIEAGYQIAPNIRVYGTQEAIDRVIEALNPNTDKDS